MRILGPAALLLLSLVSRVPAQTPAFEPPSDLYTASLHTFSVLRSGVMIDDPATGIHHPASHTQDAILSGTADRRDLSGGWYNAGDYGKWPMMAAIAVGYMLDLYELQQRAAQSPHQLAHHPDPMLLEQARWGLAWMLKMQDPDGGVRQKVDGATQASLSAAWGKAPELDPNLRIAAPASTGSTADFTAVMYQAARFFASRDRHQSRRFRAAADRAWDWLTAHPNVPAHDPFYIDHDPSGELLWAQSEHALAHHENSPALAREIEHFSCRCRPKTRDSTPLFPKKSGSAPCNPVHSDRRNALAVRTEPEVSWADPSLFGLYSLASAPSSPRPLRKAASVVILHQANALAEAAAVRPFNVALADSEYRWGSAERVLHRAALFLMAESLQPSPRLHQAALNQLAWILGDNAANHSFVTAFGANPVLHPWHWTYRDYGIVMPGWAVGGPNSSPEGVDPALRALQQRGTPPARCYVDLCSPEGSWASNEGQISEEGALVFVAGVLRLPSTRR